MSLIQEFAEEVGSTRLRIAVVGDVLLDEYYPVTVSRISPEFPVPIYLTPDEHCISMPGGAANVCHQFSRTNAVVDFFGLLNPKTLRALTPYVSNAAGGTSVIDE